MGNDSQNDIASPHHHLTTPSQCLIGIKSPRSAARSVDRASLSARPLSVAKPPSTPPSAAEALSAPRRSTALPTQPAPARVSVSQRSTAPTTSSAQHRWQGGRRRHLAGATEDGAQDDAEGSRDKVQHHPDRRRRL